MPKKLFYVLLILPVLVQAHEISTDKKFTPIINLGGRYLHSDTVYPVPRLANALEASQHSAYQNGNAFDYADVGLQVLWTNDITTLVKGSYHGQDLGNEFSIEQAWLNYGYDLDKDNMLSVRVGRQHVPLGRQNQEHSHNWMMAIEPLVMRASVGDGWRDDGLDVLWQHENGWYAGLGAYQGDSFPSSRAAGIGAVSSRLGWQQDNHYLEVSIAHFKVDGRITDQQTSLSHTHTQASCVQASANVVCFDGKSQVAVLAGQWAWPQYKTIINGEAWFKYEQGDLFSTTALVDYQGMVTGGWLTADYQWTRQLHSYLRWETLQGRHQLVGANAALLAAEAGIADSSDRPYRTGLGLVWTGDKGVRLSAEAHRENINRHVNDLFLLRYQVALWDLITLL